MLCLIHEKSQYFRCIAADHRYIHLRDNFIGGTGAQIRRAGAYPDGRLDILTVGQQRFRLEEVDNTTEPYLVGQVSLLDEPTGSLDLETGRQVLGALRSAAMDCGCLPSQSRARLQCLFFLIP